MKKITIILVMVLASAVAVGGFLFFRKSPIKLSMQKTNTVLEVNNNNVDVEIVSSPADVILGLSGRTSLESNKGMLFVMGSEARHNFWMKDMNFPIDIIWLDKNMSVVDVSTNLRPESYPQTFSPSAPAYYVLEVPEGSVEKWRVKKGDTIKRF